MMLFRGGHFNHPARAAAGRLPSAGQAMHSTSDIAAQPDADAASLPPPARARARVRLTALLLLGLGCLGSAWLLRGSAAYALLDGAPRDLGRLSSAQLTASGARGSWVKGVGEVERDTISFRRRGERGAFVLGRLIDRTDLWVLLPVPSATTRYLPPRVLEGRLLARNAMGLRLLSLSRLMQARHAGRTITCSWWMLDQTLTRRTSCCWSC